MSYKGFLSCNSRISKEDQEFYDLKYRAAEYYRANEVPQKIEGLLNEMFFENPDDIYGYMANYFSRLSKTPVINKISGKEVYDGKGQLTVQAEIYCIINNEEKWTCSAVISSHCEVPEDGSLPPDVIMSSNKQNNSVMTALQWINEALCTMLKGFDPSDQTGADKVLSDFFTARCPEEWDGQSGEKEPSEPVPEPPPHPAPPRDKKGGDKGRKGNSVEKPLPPPVPLVPVLPGSVAIGAVSLAVAKTAALLKGIPLYKHISALRSQQGLNEIHLPIPMVTIVSCGKASPGKLSLLKEVILIPTAGQRLKQIIATVFELQKEMKRITNSASKTGALPTPVSDCGAILVAYDRPEQPLDLIIEAANNLGLTLGKEIHLALNCAAHELMDYPKGKYEIMTGTSKSPDELVDVYELLTSKYPAVVALIDPFRKEDVEQWERLSTMIGSSCCLLSDVAARRPGPRRSVDMSTPPGVKGVILNHSNETTITDLLQITGEKRGETIIGTASGETCDDSLSDVAVGLGVSFLKLGGLNGGERLTKYNRLICIEEELAQQGILGSRPLKFPLFGGKAA